MSSFGIALTRLFVGFWRGLKDPDFRALAFVLTVTILGGTLFYHGAEKWSWIDSAYFSVATLATIGHPALTPTSTFSKLFTIVYMFAGIGVMIAFVVKLGGHITRRRD